MTTTVSVFGPRALAIKVGATVLLATLAGVALGNTAASSSAGPLVSAEWLALAAVLARAVPACMSAPTFPAP